MTKYPASESRVRSLALGRRHRHDVGMRGDMRFDDLLGPCHRVGITQTIDRIGLDEILLVRTTD